MPSIFSYFSLLILIYCLNNTRIIFHFW